VTQTNELVRERDDRISRYSLDRVGEELNTLGFGLLPALLTPGECRELTGCFDQEHLFRSHIVMRRHGFGEGEYKYFAEPLHALVAELRRTLYAPLAVVANGWSRKLQAADGYPISHDQFLQTCHAAGQLRPTPLLLRYREGDYNRLHQDIYGTVSFPIQVALLLDRPGVDFEGGEFVLTEQKPRSQTRVQVVPLQQGDAVAFAVNERPARGARGYYRLKMRHGVSELRSGLRHTLGIIFHDAE